MLAARVIPCLDVTAGRVVKGVRFLELRDAGDPVELAARYEAEGIKFHALRTRQAAGRSFMSVHVLVPGAWSVQRGHELLEEIERDIRSSLPGTVVFTHLEPVEDPASFLDGDLDR